MNEFLDRIVVTVMPKEHTGKKMGGFNTKISAADASISQNCVCFLMHIKEHYWTSHWLFRSNLDLHYVSNIPIIMIIRSSRYTSESHNIHHCYRRAVSGDSERVIRLWSGVKMESQHRCHHIAIQLQTWCFSGGSYTNCFGIFVMWDSHPLPLAFSLTFCPLMISSISQHYVQFYLIFQHCSGAVL